MYTTHGHYIPGTELTYPIPGITAHCKGLIGCSKCYGEAWNATTVMLYPDDSIQRISLMNKISRDTKARMLVARYYNDNRKLPDEQPELTLSEVHLVWFAKTLGNWKALVTTDIPDNVYYEVTYNGATETTYVDVYKKTDNVAFPDRLENL